MYKTKTLLLVCSLLPFLASCVSDPETHQLVPVEQPIILYADQTVDSLSFYTFDSWTVTPQADWITIDGPSHQDITYDYTKCYLCKAYLKVQPNTTGKTRTGMVLVQSYEYSYTSPFVQLGLLNVSHPLPTVDTWLNDSDYSSDGKTLSYIPYSETSAYVKKVMNSKRYYENNLNDTSDSPENDGE